MHQVSSGLLQLENNAPKSYFKSCAISGNSNREDNWVLTKECEKQGQHARPLSNLLCHLEALIMQFTDQIIEATLDKNKHFRVKRQIQVKIIPNI